MQIGMLLFKLGVCQQASKRLDNSHDMLPSGPDIQFDPNQNPTNRRTRSAPTELLPDLSGPLVPSYVFKNVKHRKIYYDDANYDLDYRDEAIPAPSVQGSIVNINIGQKNTEIEFLPQGKLYLQKEEGYIRVSLNPEKYLKLLYTVVTKFNELSKLGPYKTT